MHAHDERPGADMEERDVRRREGQQAEQVDEGRRIGRREIVDPAVERRVPHLDRDIERLVEREEHRNLDDDRQAARHRVGADALVERHHLLVEALLVVAEALAQLRHLGLKLLHLAHRAVGFVGEREEDELDDHRQQHDREAEIADQVIEEVERQEDRLGQEIEPAEIDGAVEARHARLRLVLVEEMPLPWRRRRAVRRRWLLPPGGATCSAPV